MNEEEPYETGGEEGKPSVKGGEGNGPSEFATSGLDIHELVETLSRLSIEVAHADSAAEGGMSMREMIDNLDGVPELSQIHDDLKAIYGEHETFPAQMIADIGKEIATEMLNESVPVTLDLFHLRMRRHVSNKEDETADATIDSDAMKCLLQDQEVVPIAPRPTGVNIRDTVSESKAVPLKNSSNRPIEYNTEHCINVPKRLLAEIDQSLLEQTFKNDKVLLAEILKQPRDDDEIGTEADRQQRAREVALSTTKNTSSERGDNKEGVGRYNCGLCGKSLRNHSCHFARVPCRLLEPLRGYLPKDEQDLLDAYRKVDDKVRLKNRISKFTIMATWRGSY